MATKVHSKNEGTLPNVNRASFSTYVKKILIKQKRDVSISKEALNTLDYHIYILIDEVAKICNALMLYTGVGETISSRAIQTAIRLLLPGELVRGAVFEGTNAVALHSNDVEQRKRKEKEGRLFGKSSSPVKEEKRGNLAQRLGLIISPKKVEGILRRYMVTKRMGKDTGIYLAAVLEYVVTQLLDSSAIVTLDLKKSKMTMRHLFLAVSGDEQLDALFNTLQLFYQSGVAPHINKRLSKDDKGKSARKEERE